LEVSIGEETDCRRDTKKAGPRLLIVMQVEDGRSQTPMKTFLIFIISAVTMTLSAQTSRFVTLTLAGSNQTAQVEIQDYESFRVASAFDPHAPAQGTFALEVSKPGWSYQFLDVDLQGSTDYANRIVHAPRVIAFAGPATVKLHSGFPDRTSYPAYVTLEITPQSFPPGQTLIVPPGTNQVLVTLECSTNLVNWVSATNGVYGSPTEAKFFRIRGSKVQ